MIFSLGGSYYARQRLFGEQQTGKKVYKTIILKTQVPG
jgi:hypothetical protein